MIKDMDEKELGSHHCTRENVSYTINALKRIESGEDDVDLQDWRTQSGVIALQLEWLLSQHDS